MKMVGKLWNKWQGTGEKEGENIAMEDERKKENLHTNYLGEKNPQCVDIHASTFLSV